MNAEYEAQILLRLSREMHARLKETARLEDRSVNAQICRILREWLAARENTGLVSDAA